MKLAIMQPYFFPYLGYFDLINKVDKWIVYDTVQYIKQGWINRNRILHQNSGWQFISVPLKKDSFRNSYKTAIKDVAISDSSDWNYRIIRQLEHYKKAAPFYDEVISYLRDWLISEHTSISRLNVFLLAEICKVLGIDFNYEFHSEMNVQMDDKMTAEEKVLELCKALEISEYINLPGGTDLYDHKMFSDQGIKLTFRKIPYYKYECKPYEFFPNMSIIDVLMWNDPKRITQYLNQN